MQHSARILCLLIGLCVCGVGVNHSDAAEHQAQSHWSRRKKVCELRNAVATARGDKIS